LPWALPLALFAAYTNAVGLSTIDLTNSKVVSGLLIGGTIPFLLAALTMRAVGRTAQKMVEEVRRQFREITGLLEGTAKADYERWLNRTTRTEGNGNSRITAVVAPL
jgi:K(+)-stimulated pyrophosphate-energized sodium pump